MTDTQAAPDVVDVLTADHREFLELLGRIEGTTDPALRRDLTDTVIAEVMRHAVAEEMYVYPAIAEHLPGGEQEVEEDKAEHEEIVRIMKRLERTDTDEAEFLALVRELQADLTEHIAEEEADQFPRLRAHVPAATLVELAGKVETAKRLAPTRPHPTAPHSELFHKTLGAGVGLVDRLRDRLTGRTTD
ncbi:hemerythrin domain-containing protein [Cellulomonas marina]|uniref:Hemerythrin HHE cation binding domain-containing protein n=1 Tax=Cellulomonas marina TaxID=988821 RepID=A0A1I1AUL0_9CELL|nr:hemerythrin domain-containing protein [Cellulomonas marina]GIG30730.1 hemerythrin [Cellulomonas marina]SFB41721.1 Hemerythrin HHE cation binding domain-containing protein [Cellulomonas marina]